jgi:predicted nucleic acid-binding protein
MPKGVLLDTSFFLRFLNEDDTLFKNADDYFCYFLKEDYVLFISTVTIAEFCVGGSTDELPLKNLRILPFNYGHAVRTGEFARQLFIARKKRLVTFTERLLIPNDTKLFAQADSEPAIAFFLTNDTESIKAYNILKQSCKPLFGIIDLKHPYAETFGILDL